jgi:hypothetical protein
MENAAMTVSIQISIEDTTFISFGHKSKCGDVA